MFGKKETDSIDAPEARVNRGLGPFTGRQLTIIIVTLIIVVGFPITAFAVSGSNVFITDSSTGTKAKVDRTGNLKTNVVGGIISVGAPLTDAYRSTMLEDAGASGGAILAVAPAGKALVITSIHLDVWKATATGPGEVFGIFTTPDTSCSGTATYVDDVNPNAVGLVTFDSQPGLEIASGHSLCVTNLDSTNLGADAMAYGYKVLATRVSATAAVSGPTSAHLGGH